LKLCKLETEQNIFISRKRTLGRFVKGILTTKLDSVGQFIHTVLLGVNGDCKRKLLA
jgi:hypothetical protein